MLDGYVAMARQIRRLINSLQKYNQPYSIQKNLKYDKIQDEIRSKEDDLRTKKAELTKKKLAKALITKSLIELLKTILPKEIETLKKLQYRQLSQKI